MLTHGNMRKTNDIFFLDRVPQLLCGRGEEDLRVANLATIKIQNAARMFVNLLLSKICVSSSSFRIKSH